MIKLFFTIFLLCGVLQARSSQPSNIPLPEVSVQDLDPYPCDAKCLQNYLKKGLIFSYLAYQDLDTQAKMLKTEHLLSTNVAVAQTYEEDAEVQPQPQEEEMIPSQEQGMLEQRNFTATTQIRIALLLPSKTIGKYAASTTNASFAYLMARGTPFSLKTYKLENQSYEEIQKALAQIEADGFEYVIAPLTAAGERVVAQINPELFIYFPTIHKRDAKSSSANFYYGAIDYNAQIDALLQEAHPKLAIFCDESDVGRQLCAYEEFAFTQTSGSNVAKYVIPQQVSNLEKQIKNNSRLRGSSVFLNTPVVKTGMIMSQLTLHDAKVTNILSAQVNYNPLLLTMTQYRDRKEMIIANSITHNDELLIQANAILENDIVYDWINYTTTVGTDYFAHVISNEGRIYNIPVESNQMIYPVVLLKPEASRFIPYR